MAAILRPAHQRHQTPESVTDVLSVAVCWAVACGVAGFALDLRLPGSATSDLFSWAVLGQLTGFYLGLVWVLVVLLARHVERVAGPASRTRPIAKQRRAEGRHRRCGTSISANPERIEVCRVPQGVWYSKQ